jgi:ATP-dependent Lon protease
MLEEPTILQSEGIQTSIKTFMEENNRSLVVARDILPDAILIYPLHDRPMFPKMMGPLPIDNPKMQQLILEAWEHSRIMYLGLLLVRPTEGEMQHVPKNLSGFFSVGVAARVVRISSPTEDAPLQVLVQAIERFDVWEMTIGRTFITAKARYRPGNPIEFIEELKAYAVAIIDCMKELVTLNPVFQKGLSFLIERINVSDPGSLADFAASMTASSGAELQEILEIYDVRPRIEKVLILLKKEVEISRLKARISKRIEEQLAKQQRKFFLNRQMEEIKKELGIFKDDTESEIEKFRKRMGVLSLTEEAKERIEEELDKMQHLGPESAEFNVSRAYLDWLTILPWGVYTEDSYDIVKAARILDQDHFGLADVKERILELISVGIIKGSLSGSIILLTGPPGVGKTSIGQSIARSLGRRYYRFSLGGMRDEAEIKGHRRTYIGALPGKFLQAVRTCKTSNPLIMLDEVDKIGASFQGDPASALLEVLDPEQNRNFLDHYLDVRFDLSKVLFICTANQVETIPRPLLDRMETIRLSGYIQAEKVAIARRHLIPKQLKLHGLTAKQIVISKPVLKAIIDGYAREAGVRGLENCIRKILRKSVTEIIDNPEKQVRVHRDNLPDLLGKRYFTEDSAFKKVGVGVITGLAYTGMGGATFHVESIAIPTGQPGFRQTGQLGQVMMESSEIAYSYVQALLKDNSEAIEFFGKNLIHLHVPAGATPKDGPSAGITMACSLYSLAMGKTMIGGTAMTGELTLSGLVLPIGGVKEKIIAAARAKLGHVVLPRENQEDFDLLPEHVRKGITAHFVTTFRDVMKICFH